MKQVGFSKAEKLKSTKAIDALFATGTSFAVQPVRVKYAFVPRLEGVLPVQAGVSVSKKNFKRATDRNRIKRLLREAYRLQKKDVVEQVARTPLHLDVFFMYTGKTLPTFQLIYTAVAACLHQLLQKSIAHEKNL